MVKSLQEQLMGAGLVDKKKAKAIQKEKRIQKKQTPKGHVIEDKNKEQIEKSRLEKIQKDKELNRQKMEALEKKAIQAQVKQLIKTNEVKRDEGEYSFQFTENKKIKRIYLSKEQFDHLARGILAIVSLNEGFVLLPKAVAKKIMEREQSSICYFYEKEKTETEELEVDDPYKGFEIPDDLMW